MILNCSGLIRVAGFCLAGSVVTSVLYFSQHATYCNIATACSALFMMILVGFVQVPFFLLFFDLVLLDWF
jgi:hypothetical protein